MEKAAKQVMTKLRDIPGVGDIENNFTKGKEEIRISIKDDKAAQSLLSSHDIAFNIRSALEGHIATHIYKNGDRIPVRVRFNEAKRNNLESIKKSEITNQRGQLINLNSVTEFQKQKEFTLLNILILEES